MHTPWTGKDVSRCSPPFPDGTFELEGLEAGREYRLGVYSAEQLHLGGFYAGPGAQLVANPEDGVAVQAGLAGVELATVTAVPLTGTFSVPPGFDWSAGGFGISALELTADGEDYRHRVYATVDGTAGGSFTLPFVRPGGTYVIYAWDSSARRFASGYHHAGGLTSRMWHGTPVTSLQDIHVTITPELIEPAVSAVTEPRVQGSAVVGQKLSATVGTWSLRGTSLAIQWLRDGKAVLGANGATFVLEPEDLGARLSVRVTGTADGFPAGSATSVPTAPVEAAAAPAPRRLQA